MTQRDEHGRFVKGQSGNPNGRPKKARETRYYEILVSTVTFEQWKRIVDKARQQAERGDATARKWLADYIVGSPEQNIHISGDYPVIREVVFQGPDEAMDDE